MSELELLEKQALQLNMEDRAKLAQRLLLSLDAPESEDEIEALWVAEVERRIAQLERGEVQPIPAEEVLRKARALLR